MMVEQIATAQKISMEHKQRQHFLVATYPTQGHINPALRLARRLSRITNSPITFSTAVSAHRRMFPFLSPPNQELGCGLITYSPFSDSFDDGYKATGIPFNHFISQSKLSGSRSLSELMRGLQARGRPVTWVIYTMFVPWAADVARELAIPSVLLWIQPAIALAIYYHCFHGYEAVLANHLTDPLFMVSLPGLPSLRIRELPSFLTLSTNNTYYAVVTTIKEALETINKGVAGNKPQVLVNSFDALEAGAIAAMDKIEIVSVGPLLSHDSEETASDGDLFRYDEKRYMEWLDTKPEGSVVYVSFGTLVVLTERQREEIMHALVECSRPYLWVVRKDSKEEGKEVGEGEEGMVVEWCNQAAVLSHKAVGCFVTHCGWNSALEGLACGMPMVGMPQWSDQLTVAAMLESQLRVGVRAEANAEGVVEGTELRRCLEVVMGEGERGMEIRRNARDWREKANEALDEGGPSDRNLKAFIEKIKKS